MDSTNHIPAALLSGEPLSLQEATRLIARVERYIQSPDPEIRALTCRKMAAIMEVKAAPHSKFMPDLIYMLGDKHSPAVRSEAAVAIAQSVRPEFNMAAAYAPSVAHFLKREKDWFVTCAMLAMVPRLVQDGQVEAAAFVPGVANALVSSDPYIVHGACRAARAVVKANEKTAASFVFGVQRAMDHPDPAVYQEAEILDRQLARTTPKAAVSQKKISGPVPALFRSTP